MFLNLPQHRTQRQAANPASVRKSADATGDAIGHRIPELAPAFTSPTITSDGRRLLANPCGPTARCAGSSTPKLPATIATSGTGRSRSCPAVAVAPRGTFGFFPAVTLPTSRPTPSPPPPCSCVPPDLPRGWAASGNLLRRGRPQAVLHLHGHLAPALPATAMPSLGTAPPANSSPPGEAPSLPPLRPRAGCPLPQRPGRRRHLPRDARRPRTPAALDTRQRPGHRPAGRPVHRVRPAPGLATAPAPASTP